MKSVRLLGLTAALAVSLAACGDTGTTTSSPPTTEGPAAATTTVTATTAAVTTATTTSVPATSEASTTTVPPTTIPTTTTTALAGEPTEHPFFQAGDVLGVIGVSFDDALNVRAGPGVDQPVVATLAPTTDDVVVAGRNRQVASAIWSEVTSGGSTGWVNARFLAYLGETVDVTSAIIERIGAVPTAPDMDALGLIIAETEAVVDDEITSDIILVAGPTGGDLGEIVVDVIGMADDSLLGVRLHVFGTPIAAGFELKAVELTALCGRGVAPDGLCI